MPTVYARRFDLKASLTDSEVAAFWKYAVEEFVPACLSRGDTSRISLTFKSLSHTSSSATPTDFSAAI